MVLLTAQAFYFLACLCEGRQDSFSSIAPRTGHDQPRRLPWRYPKCASFHPQDGTRSQGRKRKNRQRDSCHGRGTARCFFLRLPERYMDARVKNPSTCMRAMKLMTTYCCSCSLECFCSMMWPLFSSLPFQVLLILIQVAAPITFSYANCWRDLARRICSLKHLGTSQICNLQWITFMFSCMHCSRSVCYIPLFTYVLVSY